MRAPDFWQRPRSLQATLLRPAGFLYGTVSGQRMAKTGVRAPCPVICVGNFTLGGAGKTPTALALVDLLRASGQTPAFLSRGYGGRLAGPVQVDPARHGAADVGDEPLLLARAALTIVARDRPAGAELCAASGATVIVMDDGLQNPSLVKDLALAVVDGATGIGNGLVCPAGPLRAPLDRQWPRVDALLVVGEGRAGDAIAGRAAARGKLTLRAWLEPDPEIMKGLAGRRVFAFAGIGRPEKFFAMLETSGVEVVQRRSFPDHHAYRDQELDTMAREADAAGLISVTTEKDLVRLNRASRPAPLAIPVRLAFDDPGAIMKLVSAALQRRRVP